MGNGRPAGEAVLGVVVHYQQYRYVTLFKSENNPMPLLNSNTDTKRPQGEGVRTCTTINSARVRHLPLQSVSASMSWAQRRCRVYDLMLD